MRWALITGEYPPARGGVADYTAQLAAALAAAGDTVHVWAPGCAESARVSGSGPHLHPLPRRCGRTLERALAAIEVRGEPPQILVQYVPHAYGLRAMNLPFCNWVRRQRARRPWVMYHEVAYPLEPGQGLRRRGLALVTRAMARRLQRGAARSFVSIPAWAAMLRHISADGPAGEWLPVPSNIPLRADPRAVAALRARWSTHPDAPVVGHFGRFDPFACACLRLVLPPLLAAHANLQVLLAGAGGHRLRDILPAALRPRVLAPGYLGPAETAVHLATADLLLQPYPDGVSGRRGTAMAALGLARPLLTTVGRLSEPLWQTSGAVALVPAHPNGAAQAPTFAAAASALLDDPGQRARLQAAGHSLYARHFALEHTVARLRAAAAEN